MGRIGDGDVHAAYVEFRAKESDKVCSPSRHLVTAAGLLHPHTTNPQDAMRATPSPPALHSPLQHTPLICSQTHY